MPLTDIHNKIRFFLAEFNIYATTINENLFSIGLNSLTASQLLSRISAAFKKDLLLETFYENPSIKQLALAIYSSAPHYKSTSELDFSKRSSTASALQRKEYLTYLIKKQNNFNLNFSMMFNAVDLDTLKVVINIILERHDALRTVFFIEDGIIKQKVLKFHLNRSRPEIIDLRQSLDIPANLTQINQDSSNTLFNFDKGPLVRIKVILVPVNSAFLLLTIHHALSDATSIKILEREIHFLYSEYHKGNHISLPKPPIQLKDYTAWNNMTLNGVIGKRCKKYYSNQIRKSLLREHAFYSSETEKARSYRRELRSEVGSFIKDDFRNLYSSSIGYIGKLICDPGAKYIFILDKSYLENLHQKSIQLKTSVPMILVAAYCLAMYKHNLLKTFRIDIPMTNRIFPEFENIVGWIMGGIIACINLTDTITIERFIKKVSSMIWKMHDYRYYPLEQIMSDFDLPVDIIAPNQINFINLSEKPLRDFSSSHMVGGSAFYNLACNIYEYSNGLKFSLTYNSLLYRADQIESISTYYQEMLVQILSDSSILINTLKKKNIKV